MLDAFKLKPFDLEPIYASWKDAPRFLGNPKKDMPVDDWLSKIKAGCAERNVPKEYWHKVAQHYMGENAKARLDELKGVMAKVHGGTYRWNWEKFKIAMRNMGWTVDASETQSIKVQTKPSGLWWITPHKKDEPLSESPVEESPPAAVPDAAKGARSDPLWITRKPTAENKEKAPSAETTTRRTPQRSNTSMSLWPVRKASKDVQNDSEWSMVSPASSSQGSRPSPQKAMSDTGLSMRSNSMKAVPTPTRLDTGETITTVTHAPVWLVNATSALDFLHSEHPKAMSTLSAILITAGTLPTIPAISAGAGGAILASGAAQAVGAIAVGVGSWLKSTQQAPHEAGHSDSGSQASV